MHKCDFCGRDQTKVKRIIAGKTADICGECILLCMEVLIDDTSENFKRIESNFAGPQEEYIEKENK